MTAATPARPGGVASRTRYLPSAPAGLLVLLAGSLKVGVGLRAGLRLGVQGQRLAPEQQRLLLVGLESCGLLVLLAGGQKDRVGLLARLGHRLMAKRRAPVEKRLVHIGLDDQGLPELLAGGFEEGVGLVA